MTTPEPTSQKPPVAPSAKSGREKAKAAPPPRISIPKLLVLFACFLLYTACVIVATMQYCESRNCATKRPTSTTSSLFQVQLPDGSKRYMTAEELNEFKRTGGLESGSKIDTTVPSPPVTIKESAPNTEATETFELPHVPDVKTIRQERKSPKPLGVRKDPPPASAPNAEPPDQPVAALPNNKAEQAAPATPPAQPTVVKATPAVAPLDPAAQAKILRTRMQVYAGEVERLEKNLEIVPDTPENGDLRGKLIRRIDAARKNLKDAQAQMEALESAAKGDGQPKSE